MAAAARPGLLYILNKPLLRDAVAQRALQHWYTNTHIRDLLSINSTSNGIKRVYAYQSVDPDINGPGGFLALCPIADSSVLRTDTVGNVLSFERTILPLLSKSVTIQTSKLFTLPHRPIAMKELEKDPREGGAHLRELESEKSLVHEPKSNFVEIPPEPGLNEMLNPYENFLCPNEPFDLDRADYRNYPDFDPDQDFWCVLEPPSESSEQHYMDTKPALYDGSIPPEGLPLQSAIKIEPRLYDRIMTSDDKKWATNQLGTLFPLYFYLPIFYHPVETPSFLLTLILIYSPLQPSRLTSSSPTFRSAKTLPPPKTKPLSPETSNVTHI